MKSDDNTIRVKHSGDTGGVIKLSRKNAVRIRSAEGPGVGRSVRGASDAKALSRESAQRASRRRA